jgi:hypothetical protein
MAASISLSVLASQNRELDPLRARRFLHVSYPALGSQIIWVREQGNHLGLGNHLGKQLEPLGHQLGVHGADACNIAARPSETGDQAERDWVTDGAEDNRDRGGGVFCGQCRTGIAVGRDHLNFAGDEVSGQCRQPIVLEFRPPVLDRQVLSLDVARFAQSLMERGQRGRQRAGRNAAEKADHRHRLLRAEGSRRRHRAAQKEHQLAAPHPMTPTAGVGERMSIVISFGLPDAQPGRQPRLSRRIQRGSPFPNRLSPEDARWNAHRQAVEFGVEIGEYHGVDRVPRRMCKPSLIPPSWHRLRANLLVT